MGSADKRNSPRVNLRQVISLGNEKTLELVNILDVSAEGIAFFSKNKIEKGSSVFLMFPGNDEIKENEVEATIWNCVSTDDPGNPFFRVSAVFVDANIKYLDDIKKLYGKAASQK